ncbi:hypothetical protein [Paraburkholderia solisilvae]|uniref:PAAR domain-containing protein n=1 Tax=Paraburkholderia solisilvae TaxID=624376 RepID=A0A6J5EES5_9BURK|nr:hypothetical protein [Paraburkholderia solisilvae]CAB3764247.1 hypothetical protein LMG29739_04289 [Paraburkholderia solisilvae]
MAIFYSVVKDDPLSTGGNSRVIEGWRGSTIEGEDGRERPQTYLGQRAWCDACQSLGVIVAAPGSPDTDRMYDEELNASQALGGDLVMCKCAQRPVVIARYGRSWVIETGGGGRASAATDGAAAASGAQQTDQSFDDHYVLHDGYGMPIRNTRYTLRRGQGASESGTTDDQGHTHLLAKAASQEDIHIYVGSAA